jgi:hypothetical protein
MISGNARCLPSRLVLTSCYAESTSKIFFPSNLKKSTHCAKVEVFFSWEWVVPDNTVLLKNFSLNKVFFIDANE